MNTKEITSITINVQGVVFYAGVLDDGQDFRSSVRPGQSLIGIPQTVADYCTKNCTPELIATYNESQSE